MEDQGRTRPQPCPSECASGGVGFLYHPAWKQIRLHNRKCPLAETVFPLVSANTHRDPRTLMHTNYALAGSWQEAAGGSSRL